MLRKLFGLALTLSALALMTFGASLYVAQDQVVYAVNYDPENGDIDGDGVDLEDEDFEMLWDFLFSSSYAPTGSTSQYDVNQDSVVCWEDYLAMTILAELIPGDGDGDGDVSIDEWEDWCALPMGNTTNAHFEYADGSPSLADLNGDCIHDISDIALAMRGHKDNSWPYDDDGVLGWSTPVTWSNSITKANWDDYVPPCYFDDIVSRPWPPWSGRPTGENIEFLPQWCWWIWIANAMPPPHRPIPNQLVFPHPAAWWTVNTFPTGTDLYIHDTYWASNTANGDDDSDTTENQDDGDYVPTDDVESIWDEAIEELDSDDDGISDMEEDQGAPPWTPEEFEDFVDGNPPSIFDGTPIPGGLPGFERYPPHIWGVDANGNLRLNDCITPTQRDGSDTADDLDGDGHISAYDHLLYINCILKTTAGDADWDGDYDLTDIIILGQIGEYEDQTSENSYWREGDWNGDGEYDSSDQTVRGQWGLPYE